MEWVSGASIYIGYARYSQLGGHGFVIATAYDESEELERAVQDLDAGDNEALAAGELIAARAAGGRCWYANDADPAVAMARLMDRLREWHRELSIEQELRLAQRKT